MAAGNAAQVEAIVESINKFTGFKNMAQYNISCLMTHIKPPNPGWRNNCKAAVQCGGEGNFRLSV